MGKRGRRHGNGKTTEYKKIRGVDVETEVENVENSDLDI